MNPATPVPVESTTALLEDFSLEMTGKDIPALLEARQSIPQGTRVNVTFLGNEDPAVRIAAAKALREAGFVPVPHISARRLASRESLAEFLDALRAVGAVEEVFIVGGDPAVPEGPFADSLAVIESGLLRRHGVRRVGIAGYPEGHPRITEPDLWRAVADKHAALDAQGLAGDLITQFGFDVDPVLAWVEQLRSRGVDSTVRIGVPGPVGVKRLMSYASRFGVGTSASIARKYGFSITNLLGTAGPDRFLRELAARRRPADHGDIKIHFYTFGGLRTTSEWITRFRKEG